MKKKMKEQLDEIQKRKTMETQELFEKWGVKPIQKTENSQEKGMKLHWTRLSENSNIGLVEE